MRYARPSRPRPGVHGFTLIELLVVVSIIALLVSILLPSLKKARQLAKLTICKTNQKHVLTAIHVYAADNNAQAPQGFGAMGAVSGEDYYSSACDNRGTTFMYYYHRPVGLGLLHSSGVVEDGHVFYCPALKPALIFGYTNWWKGWNVDGGTGRTRKLYTSCNYFYRYALGAAETGIIGYNSRGDPIRSYPADLDSLTRDQPVALWEAWINTRLNQYHREGYNVGCYDGAVDFIPAEAWDWFPANAGYEPWPYDAVDPWDGVRGIPSFVPFVDQVRQ